MSTQNLNYFMSLTPTRFTEDVFSVPPKPLTSVVGRSTLNSTSVVGRSTLTFLRQQDMVLSKDPYPSVPNPRKHGVPRHVFLSQKKGRDNT